MVEEAVGGDGDRQPAVAAHHAQRPHRRTSVVRPGRRAAQKALKSCRPRSARSPAAIAPPSSGTRDVPRVAPEERIGHGAAVDQVGVALARAPQRRASKPAGRLARVEHADRRRQERVERAGQARRRRAGRAVARLATWRRACTPASVRLAPMTLTGAPSRRRAPPSAAGPCTVGAVRLDLPAVEVGALVREREPDGEPGASPQVERISSSAIWTPLSAAPLRSWSPTTQKLSAFGMREVLPDAADEAVVLALDDDRHRVALLAPARPRAESPGKRGEDLARARGA